MTSYHIHHHLILNLHTHIWTINKEQQNTKFPTNKQNFLLLSHVGAQEEARGKSSSRVDYRGGKMG